MKKTITIACLLLLFAISCLETVHAKLQSEGPVRINGEAVEVKVGGTYKPYNIKGLCYQPTPVGQAPDGAWRTSPTAAPPIYARDFQKIQDIKANTVYTFRQVNDMLMDAAADKNIKVIAGFWINSADNLSDANVRTNYITSFMAYVNTYKNHSAVLFWAIGNDTAGYTATNPADIYSLFNEMAQAAYDAEMVGESPRYHPVAVIHRAPVNNEYNDLGVGNIADDAVTPNIDIWGTIVYRQDTAAYGTFLSTINTRTNKPIWIAQWGHDAYHTTQTSPPPPAGSENETEQNDNNVPIANYFTKTVLPNDLIGGTYMEYSDEWCRAGSNSAQNTGGVPNTNILSDGFRNMEYMGVYKIADGGTDPAADVITARELFSGLQAVWNPNMAPVLAAIGNKTAFTGFLLEFTASATDEDNDNLTLDCTNMPAGATFNVITNQPGLVEKKFSWTPAATGSFPGIHFEVSDGSKADSEDIAITVNNPTLVINLNPAGSYTITEGDMLVINPVVQSPAPPCQMTAEMSPEVTDFTFTHNGQGTGTFVWTPATGAGGASYIDYTVTFTATDSTPNAGITTATIRVNKYINSNYAPVWTSPIGDIVIYQDTQLVLPVDLWQYADDEDIIGPSKSSLTFSVVSFTPPEGSQCGAQVYRDEYGHSWLKVIPQTGYFGGPTTLTIRVTDDDPANPKSADTISNVTITQMNPPVVSIISPAAYSAIKGICTIEWTASDPGGNPISMVEIYHAPYDNTAPVLPWQLIQTVAANTTHGTIVWDTRNADHAYDKFCLRIVAENSFGRRGEIISDYFTLNNIFPTVSITSPANGTIIDGTTCALTMQCTKDSANPYITWSNITVTVKVNGTAVLPANVTNNNNGTFQAAVTINDASNLIEATVFDELGNSNLIGGTVSIYVYLNTSGGNYLSIEAEDMDNSGQAIGYGVE